MKFARPCLKCQQLHKDYGDYCARCRAEINRQRESDPSRVAKKRMLYNKDYRLRRQAMVQATIDNNLPCHICKKPFIYASEITADHIDAGNPNSALAPAHSYCNSSRGNKALNN